jgi:tetratricopeptide (TPR) repeat protein
VTPLAYIALFGWPVAVMVLFAILPGRLASTIAVIGSWVLLPPFVVSIAALPDYSKTTAASLGMVLGSLIFDTNRLLSFRPRWFDVPMVLWCFSGTFASLSNGLGLYDGLSVALNQIFLWGLPYLVGRMYFGDAEGLRFFVVGMVVGALCCVPFCLFEMRFSPQLLSMFYGGGVDASIRLGGYRPQIFFGTGLEFGLWMTAASLAGWWLWRCGAIKQIGQIRFGSVLLPILMVNTVLCRSTGALLLLAAGMMILYLSVRWRTRLLLASLLLMGPLYASVRITNVWSGQQVVDLAASMIDADRAQSLGYRFMCENLLTKRALEQPVFGWGGWARSAVYFDGAERKKHVPTDGLWIIALGTKGFFGLALFYLIIALPAALFVWRSPVESWTDPRIAPGLLAAVLLGLYVVDCLLNGFANIIYMSLAGGLAGFEPRQLRAMAARRGVATTAGASKVALADQSHSLGRALKAEGRFKEAEAVWSQTLDLLDTLIVAHPHQPDLQRWWCDCANDLAWLKLHYPEPAHRDSFSAIALARRAVETYPDGASYWNTLGTAYFRAGDDALAIAALDRSTALGGGTAFDDVFLAMARARLGNREVAEHLFAQAILRMEQDDPRHPELVRFCDEAQSLLATRHDRMLRGD